MGRRGDEPEPVKRLKREMAVALHEEDYVTAGGAPCLPQGIRGGYLAEYKAGAQQKLVFLCLDQFSMRVGRHVGIGSVPYLKVGVDTVLRPVQDEGW